MLVKATLIKMCDFDCTNTGDRVTQFNSVSDKKHTLPKVGLIGCEFRTRADSKYKNAHSVGFT